LNLDYNNIIISQEEAFKIVKDYYGFESKVSSLNGEIDFNFKISADNGTYILKVSRPDFDENFIDFQDKIVEHIENQAVSISTPSGCLNKDGNRVFDYVDAFGRNRKVRMLNWVEGQLYSSLPIKDDHLRSTLGHKIALITKGLLNFSHHYMNRKFEWDVAQSLWTEQHLGLFDENLRPVVASFISLFKSKANIYDSLRKSVIHNDANDNNIIIDIKNHVSEVSTIIDFGDAIYSQTINDLAVTIAYGVMDCHDPLAAACKIVESYHQGMPLEEKELEVLYVAVGMRLCISLTKSALNKVAEPDNVYLQISEKQAITLIHQWHNISPEFAKYSFRNACDLIPCDMELDFKNYALQSKWELDDLVKNASSSKIGHLDLSIDSKVFGNYTNYLGSEIYGDEILNSIVKNNCIYIGGYGEARPIYTTDAYKVSKNDGYEHRTVHMGIDVWSRAGHEVGVPEDGQIISIYNNDNNKDYGPTIIVEHIVGNFKFYTLYGHLSKSSLTLKKEGDHVKRGDVIGYIGSQKENGNWAPHLHFQILLDRLDTVHDFYGVSLPSLWPVFSSICPDPNHLFKLEVLAQDEKYSSQYIIDQRKKILGRSLSISYNQPLTIVRGQGQYLIDNHGQKYIDTVNNVAHVGHEHPRVVEAGIQQMRILNTNTRYLNQEIVAYAEALLKTLPPQLSVIHFVNSGSEANELAMRMSKAYTKQKDMIALEIGYHGNTQGCIDISSYKFSGKGGAGKPDRTEIVPLPDAFRGMYRGENTGSLYAKHVQEAIEHLESKGRGVAAFIAESIVSCGGQIDLPNGYLKEAFQYVRNAGGVCISDEVQVGFGRVGKKFWGFELHDVVPDIVTMGKPIGNGHPLAAVACTEEIALAFANGMEFFNTFGGNPVSCAIGAEVLNVIQSENLQENALNIGEYLKKEFNGIKKQSSILKDVRGEGFFLGIEFNDDDLNPLTATTSFIANKMKDHKILMSVDGPFNNVLKIKPPMCFNKENADYLLECMSKVLRMC
jgi:4-aminobutyrate aminotransferase-like enzyme/Ser/Thr protein kinase RdoA (MazF antagonist)